MPDAGISHLAGLTNNTMQDAGFNCLSKTREGYYTVAAIHRNLEQSAIPAKAGMAKPNKPALFEENRIPIIHACCKKTTPRLQNFDSALPASIQSAFSDSNVMPSLQVA